MITANIITDLDLENSELIGEEDYLIDDDSEFNKLEQVAIASKKVCCIQWYRSTDGQVAYWGPKGARLKPFWYNK